MHGIFSFLDPSSEAKEGSCGIEGIRALLQMEKREIGEGTRALLGSENTEWAREQEHCC